VIVLDSGAFVLAFGHDLPSLRRRLADVDEVHVPDLFDAEVMNVLRHRHLAGSFDEHVVGAMTQRLRTGPIRRHPLLAMLDQMWALHDNVAMYDAAYVALAAHLGLPLVTADRSLARARGLPCQLEVF
jgi:predicted nucleic acid-binding protein